LLVETWHFSLLLLAPFGACLGLIPKVRQSLVSQDCARSPKHQAASADRNNAGNPVGPQAAAKLITTYDAPCEKSRQPEALQSLAVLAWPLVRVKERLRLVLFRKVGVN
jgi:hypothetical protein